MLRRQGMALLLTLAAVYVFVTSTLPAIREREVMRGLRVAEQTELERLRRQVQVLEQLMDALERDPLVHERLMAAQRLSPDVTGPVEVAPPAPDQ